MSSKEKNKLKTQQYLPRITLASRSERIVCVRVLYKSLSVYRKKKNKRASLLMLLFLFYSFFFCSLFSFFFLFAIAVSYLLCYFIYSLTLFRRFREILYTSQDSRMVSSNDLCWIISVVYATSTVVCLFCSSFSSLLLYLFWLCELLLRLSFLIMCLDFICWRTNVTETL